jgi:hypothetical protein
VAALSGEDLVGREAPVVQQPLGWGSIWRALNAQPLTSGVNKVQGQQLLHAILAV